MTKREVVRDSRPIEDIFAGMTLIEMTFVPGVNYKVFAEAIAEAVVDNLDKFSISEDGRLSRDTILAVKTHIESDPDAIARLIRKWNFLVK